MTKFHSSKSQSFLDSIPQVSLDDASNNLTRRCKFNFSYFHVQACSQDFCDWTPDQLHKLMDKLKFYSHESLEHWQNQPIGSHGKVLAIYEDFPKKTDFERPRHIPHQAWWGRFRLESAVRLVGFIVPESHAGKVHSSTKEVFDRNTFYVVYLDKDHRFYKTEKR